MLQEIKYQGQLMAIILRSHFHKEGIHFFTPDEFSQQLAYMNRPKDYVIPPHVHCAVPREVTFTREVLYLKKGKVRVDFYSDHKEYIESEILLTGDVLLLAFGGHGFEMLEDSEIIEVKQGPYPGEEDKQRFEPVEKNKINFKHP